MWYIFGKEEEKEEEEKEEEEVDDHPEVGQRDAVIKHYFGMLGR